MAFVVETKCSRKISKSYIKDLPLDKSVVIPACGRSGGLWLLWDEKLQVQVMSANRWFIHVRIKPPDKEPWSLVCVYGDPSHTLNSAIWEDIKVIVRQYESVCIVGDFNAIAKEEEKVGGIKELNNNSKEFRDFLFEAGLVDLGYKGPAFTWTNKQHTSRDIFERLDRVVTTTKWIQQYMQARVHHMPRTHSNHASIILRTQSREGGGSKFKVENWWMATEGFRESWEASWRESEGLEWKVRMQVIQKAMQRWANTQQTPHNKLKQAENQLYSHQMLHPTLQDPKIEEAIMTEYTRAESDLEILLKTTVKVELAL